MNIQEVLATLPKDFADNSRVWVYQSTRPFSEAQIKEVNEQLYQFYAQWTAHGAPVKGWAEVLLGRFIIIMADETDVPVTGCSTDASVRLIKSIERQYDTTLFDRLSITFLVNGKPEVLPLHQVQVAIDKGFINEETLMFNNLVSNKAELESRWLQPLKESWLINKVNLNLDQKED